MSRGSRSSLQRSDSYRAARTLLSPALPRPTRHSTYISFNGFDSNSRSAEQSPEDPANIPGLEEDRQAGGKGGNFFRTLRNTFSTMSLRRKPSKKQSDRAVAQLPVLQEARLKRRNSVGSGSAVSRQSSSRDQPRMTSTPISDSPASQARAGQAEWGRDTPARHPAHPAHTPPRQPDKTPKFRTAALKNQFQRWSYAEQQPGLVRGQPGLYCGSGLVAQQNLYSQPYRPQGQCSAVPTYTQHYQPRQLVQPAGLHSAPNPSLTTATAPTSSSTQAPTKACPCPMCYHSLAQPCQDCGCPTLPKQQKPNKNQEKGQSKVTPLEPSPSSDSGLFSLSPASPPPFQEPPLYARVVKSRSVDTELRGAGEPSGPSQATASPLVPQSQAASSPVSQPASAKSLVGPRTPVERAQSARPARPLQPDPGRRAGGGTGRRHSWAGRGGGSGHTSLQDFKRLLAQQTPGSNPHRASARELLAAPPVPNTAPVPAPSTKQMPGSLRKRGGPAWTDNRFSVIQEEGEQPGSRENLIESSKL